MATILNTVILDSAILHKTLTQTNSVWLKLIHSHSTWWWQPSWTLSCWIQPLPICKNTPCYLHLRSYSTWLMAATPELWLMLDSDLLNLMLDSDTLNICHLRFSYFAQTLLTQTSSDSASNSFTLIHLDEGSHLEFCHLGFSHVAQNSDSI